MKPKRVFAGWHKPWVHLFADWLGERPELLRRRLVVVPTRESGRRLRERLVENAVHNGTGAILGPRLATPDRFFQPATILPDVIRWAGWIKVLREAKNHTVQALFPGGIEGSDDGWLLGVARQIEQARESLASVNAGFDTVAAALPEEADRWSELVALERRVVSEWIARGCADPVAAKRTCAQNPVVPAGIEEVVIAGIADPTRLAVEAWERLAGRGVPFTVLVGAPGSLETAFDDWGRPRPDYWAERSTSAVPEPTRVVVAADAPGLAEAVVQSAAGKTHVAIAVGLCDGAFLPEVMRRFQTAGWMTYDPQGVRVAQDGWPELFEALAGALEYPRDYAALARVARHPVVWQAWLKEAGAREVFAALETWERMSFASDPGVAISRLKNTGGDNRSTLCAAGLLLEKVHKLIQAARGDRAKALTAQLRQWIGATSPELLERLQTETGAWECLDDQAFSLPLRMRWLAASVSALAQGVDPSEAALALQGWLELPYDPAPHLVIAGMHEGKVPEAPAQSPIVSSVLRERLRLADRKSRLAREVFLYTAMVEGRREGGSVTVVTAQVDPLGEPCRPSRVLLHAHTRDLPGRVRNLIREHPDAPLACTPAWGRASWELRPPAGAQPNKPWSHLSPSTLRAYLDCPTRFYFTRVLGWEDFAPFAQELDGATFGVLLHEVLREWGQDPRAREFDSEEKLKADWLKRLKKQATARFGKNPSPVLSLQILSAEERLAALAGKQAQQRQDGWRVVEVEKELNGVLTLAGRPLWMRVDRIDRHVDGRVRVVDYKTSKRADSPRATHLRVWRSELHPPPLGPFVIIRNKPYGWSDLQLPLYASAVRHSMQLESLPLAGYALLPEAVGKTDFQELEALEEAIDSALAWAEEAARRIVKGVFWPPSPEVEFDLFGAIAPEGLQQALGEEWAHFLAGNQGGTTA